MIEPDVCTSLSCTSYGCDYCRKCSHAIFFGSAKIGKRVWKWEYLPRYGPMFFNKDGSEKKCFPVSEKHPVWKEYNKWEKEKGL